VIGSFETYLKSQILKAPSSSPEANKFGDLWFHEITLTSDLCPFIIKQFSLGFLKSYNLMFPSEEQTARPFGSDYENYISSNEESEILKSSIF